jgi:hypothetical protein
MYRQLEVEKFAVRTDCPASAAPSWRALLITFHRHEQGMYKRIDGPNVTAVC